MSTLISRLLKLLHKGTSKRLKLLLQPPCANAITAGPRLCPTEVAALEPIMRILHSDQLEHRFPIRPFILQRGRTTTRLNPPNILLRQLSRVVHPPELLSFSIQ